MSRSKFSKWFTAQFGKRPSNQTIYNLHQKATDLKYDYAKALQEYEMAKEWDEKFQSCLTTWIAKKP